MRILAVLLLAAAGAAAQAPDSGQGWISMFDGKSLKGWKEATFPGRGKVEVRDGMIVLGSGASTGIAWTGAFPKSGYEVRFEASRLEGKDFFAGIVFPVKDTHCSWISGGWDGTVVGLSNLEGNDASENDTSSLHEFEHGRWYKFRLLVSETRVQAWIDGAPVVDIDYTKRKLELRFDDSDLLIPIGFSSYRTVGGLRNVQYRELR